METPTRYSYDNPYYVTGNDHSGLVLVSNRLTGAGDFGLWHQFYDHGVKWSKQTLFR